MQNLPRSTSTTLHIRRTSKTTSPPFLLSPQHTQQRRLLALNLLNNSLLTLTITIPKHSIHCTPNSNTSCLRHTKLYPYQRDYAKHGVDQIRRPSDRGQKSGRNACDDDLEEPLRASGDGAALCVEVKGEYLLFVREG